MPSMTVATMMMVMKMAMEMMTTSLSLVMVTDLPPSLSPSSCHNHLGHHTSSYRYWELQGDGLGGRLNVAKLGFAVWYV